MVLGGFSLPREVAPKVIGVEVERLALSNIGVVDGADVLVSAGDGSLVLRLVAEEEFPRLLFLRFLDEDSLMIGEHGIMRRLTSGVVSRLPVLFAQVVACFLQQGSNTWRRHDMILE